MPSITAVIEWELDVDLFHPDQDAIKIATEQLSDLLPSSFTIKNLKVSYKGQRQNRIILGVFTPEEVLPFITTESTKKKYDCGNKSYFVKVNSHRYLNFKKSRHCIACGLEGNKFVLERQGKTASPHFNLYAEEDGDLVLMTKDHILARSAGGKDEMENYQTMCCTCNNLKSNFEMTVEQVAELRKFKNEHKHKRRKELAHLIKKKREEIMAGRVYSVEECSVPVAPSVMIQLPGEKTIPAGGASFNVIQE